MRVADASADPTVFAEIFSLPPLVVSLLTAALVSFSVTVFAVPAVIAAAFVLTALLPASLPVSRTPHAGAAVAGQRSLIFTLRRFLASFSDEIRRAEREQLRAGLTAGLTARLPVGRGAGGSTVQTAGKPGAGAARPARDLADDLDPQVGRVIVDVLRDLAAEILELGLGEGARRDVPVAGVVPDDGVRHLVGANAPDANTALASTAAMVAASELRRPCAEGSHACHRRRVGGA